MSQLPKKKFDERVSVDELFDKLEGMYPAENIAQFSKLRKQFRGNCNLMVSVFPGKGLEAAEHIVAALFVLCQK